MKQKKRNLSAATQLNEPILPKFVVPIVTVTFGYPAKTPEPIDQLPLEGFVHYKTYWDYSSKDIDRIYAYKESLTVNSQFIKENNKKILAQVFADVCYTKAANETFSALFLAVLKKQGFGTGK